MTTLPESSLLQGGRFLALQAFTIVWMVAECSVSLFSAYQAHSPVLLAFGFDSFVELCSASLVLSATATRFRLNQKQIDRTAGILLFLLAITVAAISVLSVAGRFSPEASPLGIAVTAVALLVMPLLAWQKRKLARQTANHALAADAVQSATCAYLAFISLAGLTLNAVFQIAWADSLAALAAIPMLIIEGRRAMRGQSCNCCR